MTATPRKFDEKIAIQKQKTHEDVAIFNAVMEESRKARAEQSSMAINNGDFGECAAQQVQNASMKNTGSMSGLVSISGHGIVSPVSSGGSNSGAPQSRYLCPSYPNHVTGRAGSLPNVTQLLRHQAPPRNGIQEAVNALNILTADNSNRRGSGVTAGAGVVTAGGINGINAVGAVTSMGLERRLSRSSDGRGSGRGASTFHTGGAAATMSSNMVVQQQQVSPNHCPTPISRHRIDTSPYGNYLLPINNDNMYRRTISDSRLYESASQPRQVPVPGIPFRPSASEYGPGPAPKLSFKAKSTHAHPGRPIHLLAGRRKMSDEMNAVSYKANRDFPIHHSSPSPDSSAQQSPDTGSPATPGTRQHSLTVASPPILNCVNHNGGNLGGINIPMQVDNLNSVLCPPDNKVGPCNGANTPGGSLPDLSSFSPGGPGSHPMLQGCYPNAPGGVLGAVSSVATSGGRANYVMADGSAVPLQLIPQAVSMIGANQNDPMVSHLVDGVAVVSPSTTHQRRLPLHRTSSNSVATCQGGVTRLGQPRAPSKFNHQHTSQQPLQSAQTIVQINNHQLCNQTTFNNSNNQQLNHQLPGKSRGGGTGLAGRRAGPPHHVAAAAARVPPVGGVIDRRNGASMTSVAFPTSPHLPVGNNSPAATPSTAATIVVGAAPGAKPHAHNQQATRAVAISIPAAAAGPFTNNTGSSHVLQQQQSPYHTILSTSPSTTGGGQPLMSVSLEPLHIAADASWASFSDSLSGATISTTEDGSTITSYASDNSSVCLPLNLGGNFLNCSTSPLKVEAGDLSVGRVCSSVDPYAVNLSPNTSPTVTQASAVATGVLEGSGSAGELNSLTQTMWSPPLPLGNVSAGLFQQPQFCRPLPTSSNCHSLAAAATAASCAVANQSLNQKSLQDPLLFPFVSTGSGPVTSLESKEDCSNNINVTCSSSTSSATSPRFDSSREGAGAGAAAGFHIAAATSRPQDVRRAGPELAAGSSHMQFHDSAYMESLMNAASLSQIHEQMSYMRVSQDICTPQTQMFVNEQLAAGGNMYTSPVGEEMLLSGNVAGTDISSMTPTDLSVSTGGNSNNNPRSDNVNVDFFEASIARGNNVPVPPRSLNSATGVNNSQGGRQFQDALSRPIPNIVLTESEGAEMDFFSFDADDGMGLQPLTDADLRMLDEGELNPDENMVSNQFESGMQTNSSSSVGVTGGIAGPNTEGRESNDVTEFMQQT